MKETMDKDPDGFAAVDWYPPEELEGYTCILGSGADERNSGYFGSAVRNNGDITGVFNGDGKDGGKEAMIAAIANGGDRLDAYAIDNATGEPGKLAHIYHKYGFEPVARVAFDAQYAPAGLPPQDIVVYKHNGDSAETVAAKYGTYPPPVKQQYDTLPVMGYEEAISFRDSQLG